MCGIFGYVTDHDEALGPILIDAGRRLSYRGYDTVGCATLAEGRPIDLRKDAGRMETVAQQLAFSELRGSRGILQLRWATFGAPSQVNAQPHLDSDGEMVGAHNGNVVNNVELRRQFMAEGLTVRSENDGESCVHAVERYVKRGQAMVEAIRSAYGDLQGDYAFVIGQQGQQALYAVKKGSGLVVGIGEGFTCLSSDLPSLLPLTRRIMRVEDGEIVSLWPDHIELHRVSDGAPVKRDPEIIVETMESAQKGGYAHFMLKEIHEQPHVAAELLHLLDRSEQAPRMLDAMAAAKTLYLVGCGTSYHACVAGAVFIARLAGKPAVPVLAPQFIAQYGPALQPGDVGIFVSQSGETKDVLNAIQVAQAKGITILGLVNVIGSTLTRVSAAHLPLACGYEISVPATKTFTNQVLAFLYLALRLGGGEAKVLASLPDLIERTIAHTEAQLDGLEDDLAAWNDLYLLGYGLTYPMALEGALKLKEITYAHAEGMLSTEFKHGPLSAVTHGYPVVFVAGSEDTDLMISGVNEVTCRGGQALVIGPDDARLRANASRLVTLPDFSLPGLQAESAALLSILPLQLLAYRLSLKRGCDPDFPRNLSKTLTVD